MIIIEEKAMFIADSHYPHHGDVFLKLLQKLENEKVQTSQLFLMGDNFDLLFGYNEYIKTFSYEAIVLLQRLSKKLEINYLEGNHDFCLKELFPDIRVYSRDEQPIYFQLAKKTVAISHGDKYGMGLGYEQYCKILRNKTMLTLLKPFEKAIIDHRMNSLAQKNICHTFHHFEKRVDDILEHYKDVDLVIEGHYHQSRIIGKYISLPSLACQGKIAVIEKGDIVFKTV